ncbi:zinc-binding alcohol dehydrogenase family protein [Maribacter sp. ACAM166]|uniref:zinc-binding alcohol dehydrogenase family protein n=1 Tax=Maribacter sp. ACAM166 TaxID=2508996 RepID=UPI0010FEFB69|nr:zinc-binding alcohol dehydrogenase family protein [Maribacter sp. ACAM166]TLP71926.1 zinc-binding alcohol dehydrogenase family protein [Maribacter sp. ACAM166]
MKYIVCEKPGLLRLKNKDRPKFRKGFALVKILRVGICGTDLHAYSGNQAFFNYPRILGHELAAQILEIEDNKMNIKKGDQVVIMPYMSCGECVACENGKTNCCANIKVIGVHEDGGMQEEILVREDLLLKSNHLTFEQMAIVEPLAIGAHAIRRAGLEKNEKIVVVGSGPIGIGIAKLAQIAGAEVIMLDINDYRLEYAKKELGVPYVVNVKNNPVEKVKEITNGALATVVFDATGSKGALESGIKFMAHGGRYVLVGLSKGDLVFQHPDIHAKESSILCSRNATIEDFEKVMSIIDQFPTDSFVTHQVAIEDIAIHFDSWVNPDNKVIKAMVYF